MITNAKTCTNFGSIAFIYDFFPNLQSSQYVGNAINLLLQGFGVVHQYVGKERALQITSE
jgi:hypothetical protein